MKTLRLAAQLLLAFALLFTAGCVTKTDANTGAKSTDWPASTLNVAKVVAPSLQASVKVAARAVAAHNPSHAAEFQLSGAAAAVLFDVASPTADNFKAALLKVWPNMAPQDVADLADILAGGWASVDQALQQQGVAVSLTTLIKDPQYKQAADLLLGAVVSGFNDGIRNAAAPAANASAS